MQPSEDERVLAALSHASIVANVVNLAGLIATALIWTTQRERSRYVRAHALQALVYQGGVVLISIVLSLFWVICLALSLAPAALRPDLYRSSPPAPFWVALVTLAVPVGFGFLATLYGLYGAYRAYRGRPFRYPLAGRLARDLPEQANGRAAAAAPQPPAHPAPAVTAPIGGADAAEEPAEASAPAMPPLDQPPDASAETAEPARSPTDEQA
jgi:uncharacterized Tic20 family protein